MIESGGTALVWTVALVAVILLPLVSWLIAAVGEEISADVDGRPVGRGVRGRL